jgi:ERCC4-type nuclease
MVIIQDTREQSPFNFSFYGCDVAIATLKTGDYTIEGYEHIVCIERKKSASELATNLGKYRERFENELERMREFKHRYIVCEFSEDNLRKFPHNAKIPKRIKKYIRMNGKYMRKRLYEYEEEYDVEIIFCEDKTEAEARVIEIFQQVVKENG